MFERKKDLLWAKLRVGMVVSIALAVLVLAVFFAGSIEDFIVPKVKIMADMKDVRGLRRGAPVWVSGIEVGAVRSIDLHPQYGTLVTLSLREDALQYIRKDSEASVMTMGLLGDKYIEIGAGSPGAPQIAPGDMIAGRVQLEMQDIVNASLQSLKTVTEFVEKLDRFVLQIERSEGTVARFFTDSSVYDNLSATTKNLATLLKDVNESNGSFRMLIEDPSLYQRLASASASMEEFGKKLSEGSGTLKRLAEDPKLYENVEQASRQLASILEKIDSGQGTAGRIIGDRNLERELRSTIADMQTSMNEFRDLVRDIREHPDRYIRFSLF